MALTRPVRDVSLRPTWFQFFSVKLYRCWKKNIYLSEFIINSVMFFSGMVCFEVYYVCRLKMAIDCIMCLLEGWHMLCRSPLKDELERLPGQQIIIPLGIDETSERCNSFILVPKVNGKVRLCLDPPRLNKVLIRPVPRGPTLNNILQRLEGMKCLLLMDASLGYYNLKLDEKILYLTTFWCPFFRYWYIWLPFEAAPLFQKKIHNTTQQHAKHIWSCWLHFNCRLWWWDIGESATDMADRQT